MQPPFGYFGGKMSLAPWIVQHFPEHNHYVEPFAGSLSVLLAKKPSRHETVNDLDEDIITFWRVLREQPDELMYRYACTPHARKEHEYAKTAKLAELPDIERARLVWVQLSQNRSSIRQGAGWRYTVKPDGTGKHFPRVFQSYLDRVPAVVQRLRNVTLECQPAIKIIDVYGHETNSLLYVDPPYLGQSRSAGGYIHDMTSENEHRELAEALNACQAAVVLSGYHSPLYAKLYKDWNVIEAKTSVYIGAKPDRTEVLWTNRDTENRLF